MKRQEKRKEKRKLKQEVMLSRKDTELLKVFVKKGIHSAREITRAKILLRSNRKETDVFIAAQEDCSRSMVKDVRIRYSTHGLDFALYDRPRSGQPPKLDAKTEAFLIATACSDAPEGNDHWTLELLREKMIKDKKVESISTVTLWNRLNSQGIKPWTEKNVVCS
jgi:MoxR-like ATPase